MREKQRVIANPGGCLNGGAAFCNELDKKNPFDTVIQYLLIGLLVFMPLAFGVVQAWSEQVVIVVTGVIVICFLLKLVCYPGQRVIRTWCYVPLAIFLLIVIFQLIPLPACVTGIISSNTVELKTELLRDLPGSEKLLRTMTLSFYSLATRHDFRLVLAVAAVFIVVLNVFRRPGQIKNLLMAIALIGGFIAFITLAQNVLGNGKIYWLFATPNSEGYSGPFINHNNYGQFINLSIGAAFGLFAAKLREGFAGRKTTAPVVFEFLSSASAKSLWLLAAVISLCSATVFLSLTRGGIISMLIAICFTTLVLIRRRSLRGHGWIMAAMALAAFTCVLYVGFDAVYERLATLRNFSQTGGGRLQILKDIAIAGTRFPILGTGLGTHSVVYPMFDHSTITQLAAHAENEYAQAVEETGLLGLAVLIIFGVIIWSHYTRNIRCARLPIQSAAYGLGFGILAILIHSLGDFGQHLPANSFLSAIFCALLVVLAKMKHEKKSPLQMSISCGKPRVLRLMSLLIVFGVWCWALVGSNNCRLAEGYWEKTLEVEKTLAEKNWDGDEDEYTRLISNAEKASAYEPENIRYHYWLNVYRWRSISETISADIWQTVIPESSLPDVGKIVGQFNKGILLCPTYGPSYSMAGQIEKFILNNNSGSEKIRKGYRLAPCDAIACFVAGELDVSEGKANESFEKFERAVKLNGSLFRDVVDIYINYLSRPDLAISIAGENTNRLNYVAHILEDMQYQDLSKKVWGQLQNLLVEKSSQSDASARIFASLANVCRRQDNDEAAIENYRRALAIDYGQVNWRFALAGLLSRVGEKSQAIDEARICLRLRPQFKAAERLIAELSVQPEAFEEVVRAQ
ncbi:O-antigen ligase family protein [Planctomycetota bacterium]